MSSLVCNSSSESSDTDSDGSTEPTDFSQFSAETLAALQWHFNGSPPEENPSTPVPSTTASVNGTVERLKAADAIKEAKHQGEIYTNLDDALKTNFIARPSVTNHLVGSTNAITRACTDLLSEGCVRLNNCLSKELCDEVLNDVNTQMAAMDANTKCGERTRENGFGGVLARVCRYDMYQRNTGVFQKALRFMLGNHSQNNNKDNKDSKDSKDSKDNTDNNNTTEERKTREEKEEGEAIEDIPNTEQLRKLFAYLFETIDDVPFTELSVLISDPGAPRQQLHPDNQYQSICPLYTVFIALQDITLPMGPTVFLPKTNTEICHKDFKQSTNDYLKDGSKENDIFLTSREWRSSCLKKGDVQILDSRCLHAATANVSDQRRALLYFTLRNPKCLEFGLEGTPIITEGSLFKDVNICLADYSKK